MFHQPVVLIFFSSDPGVNNVAEGTEMLEWGVGGVDPDRQVW